MVKYLIKVIEPFKGLKKGDEIIVSQSFINLFKNCIKVLKEIKEKPDMVIK